MYDEVSRHTFNILHQDFIVDDKFQLLRIIGNGSYSTVCSSRYENIENIESNGALVAIKKIKGGIKIFTDLNLFKRSLRELFLLKQFKGHPNIVCLYDVDLVFYSSGQLNGLYLYEELLDCDLLQIIKSNQSLTVAHHQSFIYQILCALKYIHSANVILRDLKPSNILVTEDCQLKICDFGLARGFSSDPIMNDQYMTEYVTSRWYRAPEIMLTYSNYSPAVDVWSLGCILAELMGRQPIFQGMDYVNQLNRILQILGTPPYKILKNIGSDNVKSYILHLGPLEKQDFNQIYPDGDPDALQLLDMMLQYDSTERITVDQALNHKFLSIWHDTEEEFKMIHSPIEISFEKIDDPDILKTVLIEEVLNMRHSVREDNSVTTPTRLNMINNTMTTQDTDDSSSDDVGKGLEINQDVIQDHVSNNLLAPPVVVMGTTNDNNSLTQHTKSSSSSLEKDLENGLDGRSF